MVNFSRALSLVPWYYYFSTLLHNHNDFQNVACKLWNHFTPCWALAVIQKTADLRKVHKTTVHSGADGEPLAQVCPPAQISEHIHNARQSWGDRPGLALSCFISNGGLPGDSTCQPREPQSFSQVPYGRPSPIPLAGPVQRQEWVWTPALPPLSWHCHRACPAHCQLPTLGQRTQTAAPAYLTATAAQCSQALRTGVEGNVSNIYCN